MTLHIRKGVFLIEVFKIMKGGDKISAEEFFSNNTALYMNCKGIRRQQETIKTSVRNFCFLPGILTSYTGKVKQVNTEKV